MLKTNKLREKGDEELFELDRDLMEDYFKLRFQHTTGQMENPTKLRLIRKDIARVKTIIRERKLGLQRQQAKSGVEEGGKK
jgi:large subunit ribosomal protein L29